MSDTPIAGLRLSLVVLRSADPTSLVAFYRRVGLVFVEERHGDGPVHYAATLATGVIEIYPSERASRVTFGLATERADEVAMRWAAAGGSVDRDRGVLRDPEGNVVVVRRAGPAGG